MPVSADTVVKDLIRMMLQIILIFFFSKSHIFFQESSIKKNERETWKRIWKRSGDFLEHIAEWYFLKSWSIFSTREETMYNSLWCFLKMVYSVLSSFLHFCFWGGHNLLEFFQTIHHLILYHLLQHQSLAGLPLLRKHKHIYTIDVFILVHIIGVHTAERSLGNVFL